MEGCPRGCNTTMQIEAKSFRMNRILVNVARYVAISRLGINLDGM